MDKEKWENRIAKIPKDISFYVQHSMLILHRINTLLEEKFEGDINLVALKMNLSLDEVQLLFNGVQNFDLMIISKLEAAFDQKIIQII